MRNLCMFCWVSALVLAMSSCKPLKEYPLEPNSYLPLSVGNEWVYVDSVWYAFDSSDNHLLASNEIRFYVKERDFYEYGEKKKKGMYEAFRLEVYDDAGKKEFFVRPLGREIYTFGGDLLTLSSIQGSIQQPPHPVFFPVPSVLSQPTNFLPTYGIDPALPTFFWMESSFQNHGDWAIDFDNNGIQEKALLSYRNLTDLPPFLEEFNGQNDTILVPAGQFICERYREGFWKEEVGFVMGEYSDLMQYWEEFSNGPVFINLRIHRKRVLKSFNID